MFLANVAADGGARMRKLFLFVCFGIVQSAFGESFAMNTPATPFRRPPPHYPVECMPTEAEIAKDERVVVSFNVAKSGFTEDARVMETTNACFDNAALEAVNSWVYKPKRVGREVKAQQDFETTITFRFEEEPILEDFDAKPLKRTPPRYPNGCQQNATNREIVFIEYDVDETGQAIDPRIIETSDQCFNKSAIAAIRKWKFTPRTLDGEPVLRRNVRTSIAYELAGRGRVSPQMKVRRPLATRLLRVQKLQQRKRKSPAELLTMLSDVEKKYAEDFTFQETDAFYRVRAGVYLDMKDYVRARNDLSIVSKLDLAHPSSRSELATFIRRLDATIQAQENEQAQLTNTDSNAGKTQVAPGSDETDPSSTVNQN